MLENCINSKNACPVYNSVSKKAFFVLCFHLQITELILYKRNINAKLDTKYS